MEDEKELHTILSDLAATRQQLDMICRQTSKIFEKLDQQENKLDELSLKISALETQNKVLKWIIGALLSAAAIAVTWTRGS